MRNGPILALSLAAAAVFSAMTAPQAAAQFFSDDFDSLPEGPIQGSWTVFQGEWLILDQSLQAMTSGTEPEREAWIWAGSPPLRQEGDFRATLDVFHLVGHQGGVMLCATVAESRWSAATSGYTIDWNPSFTDGFRLTRWDRGVPSVLHGGRPGTTFLPPQDWVIEVTAERIALSVGGERQFDIVDATHRGGHFGLWVAGAPGHLAFDRVELGPPLARDMLLLRGDCNSDGSTAGVADAIAILARSFLGARVECLAACDVNGDGATGGVTDAVTLLMSNFVGGVQIPEPFPACGFTGRDSDFVLGCHVPSPACR